VARARRSLISVPPISTNRPPPKLTDEVTIL
jgi:hypothetical protein